MLARFRIGFQVYRTRTLQKYGARLASSNGVSSPVSKAEDLLRRTEEFYQRIDIFQKESQKDNFALFSDWRHILFKIPQQDSKLLCQSAHCIDKLLHTILDQLLKNNIQSSAERNKSISFYIPPKFLDDLTTGIYAWGRTAIEDANSPEKAEALFKKYKELSDNVSKNNNKQALRPTASLYSALVYCWSQAINNERSSDCTLSWFRKINENRTMTVDAETWNAVLRIHVRQGKLKFSSTTRNLLNKYSSLNNGYTYVSLVEGWMKSNLPHGPEKAYEELQRGIKYCIEKENRTPALQQLIFQFLSQSIEQDLDISVCEQVLNQVINIQDSYTRLEILHIKHFIVVMNALASRGDTDKVNVLFQKLQNAYERGSQGLQPNYQVLVIVLSTLAKKKNHNCLEECEGLLDMIESYMLTSQQSSSSYIITNHAYNVILDCYIRIRHVTNRRKRVEKMIKRMEQLSISYDNPLLLPDKVSYAALLSAVIQEGQSGYASETEAIVREMELSDQVSMKPDRNIYTIVLDAIFKEGDDGALFRAKNVMDRMEQHCDLKPDNVMCTLLMKIHSLSDDVQGSNEVLHKMIEAYNSGRTDCYPSEIVFITAMSTWELSGRKDAPDASLRIFNSMVSLYQGGNVGCRPSLKTFGILMVILAKSEHKSKLQIGQRLFYQMELYGIDPDLSLLNWYIRVCATVNSKCSRNLQKENWMEALLTFDRIRGNKLANSHSYNSILYACNSLIYDPNEKCSILSDIFSKCQNDGLVDGRILASLKRFVPPKVFHDLTNLNPREKRIDMAQIPTSWKRNRTSIQ
mmetsp:Transcript_49917/g.53882  ORF Transcript_49917/g.53882 Transcript_49917/m.53882 type:complete len:804 (-) Transcript_49917:126-2537(-)